MTESFIQYIFLNVYYVQGTMLIAEDTNYSDK